MAEPTEINAITLVVVDMDASVRFYNWLGFDTVYGGPDAAFTSLKIGMAASLVGAIVGELPTGAIAGLGARLLAGSYYGQTIQIWSALIMAAALAATLVGIIGVIQRVTLRRMGMS